MLYEGLNGDPTQRWRDKYNAVWGANGSYYCSVDHSSIDGMVMVFFNFFQTNTYQSMNGKWNGPVDLSEL